MEAKIYTPFFDEVKNKIRAAQYAAMREVNIQLIQLYWEIGRSISEKQKLGWGKSVVQKLSDELLLEFPKSSGFSAANLWLMAQFYNNYYQSENLVPMVREIPWTHNVVILKRVKSMADRSFYITKCLYERWTKAQLIREIENETHLKILNSQNSFLDHSKEKLITLKDKYLFDFLATRVFDCFEYIVATIKREGSTTKFSQRSSHNEVLTTKFQQRSSPSIFEPFLTIDVIYKIPFACKSLVTFLNLLKNPIFLRSRDCSMCSVNSLHIPPEM